MEQKFLKLEKVHDIYAKATEIANFICQSRELADIENLRDKLYLDMIKKAFRDSEYKNK